jgi:hypothetical protein
VIVVIVAAAMIVRRPVILSVHLVLAVQLAKKTVELAVMRSVALFVPLIVVRRVQTLVGRYARLHVVWLV